jgi:hypothetical protein
VLMSAGQRQTRYGQVASIARPIRGRRFCNLSEYEVWRKQPLGEAATRPHRITYRRLTR